MERNYQREWLDKPTNKEKKRQWQRDAYNKSRTPFYIVYCIPNEFPPYCGMTNRPLRRMEEHRYYNDRDLGPEGDEWYVLNVCETRAEALAKEREYHLQGFGGMKDPSSCKGGKPNKYQTIIFCNTVKAWKGSVVLDSGKRYQVKRSKNRQVVEDAMEEWRKNNLK